jgi:2-hydroxy-3-keto-5-methylthiopentenyl-1-phosphate phosphatase
VLRTRPHCHVLVDFDGTIAALDTTDALLERFADPAWLDIEAEWRTGRIGSRECMVRQVDLIRATPAEIDDFLAGLAIDPGFPAFAAYCKDQGFGVSVVSDGLDRTVTAVLERHGLDFPIFANKLEWRGGDRWRLMFPHARSDCRALSGNCKCQFTAARLGQIRVVVGDGQSDFCVAGEVDLVLAKSKLIDHCRKASLPFFAFSTFDEAAKLLAVWLAERSRPTPKKARVLQPNVRGNRQN